MSGWSIKLPYRSREDELLAVADACRALPKRDDRALARQIALRGVTSGLATAGELLDQLDPMSPAERRADPCRPSDCTPWCRHQGPRSPEDRRPADHEQIARLFDEGRDPDERVRYDDWHPNGGDEDGATWTALDGTDTVGRRREWYWALFDWR
jgi:hypothetical protein